jgi:CheY-like chemotaxis protein
VEILSNRDSTANPGGGRAARILVADDNSNIQRMVALALKDHGIDVLAVGNGEAAVRSMAQVTPDLILADVFMPVRSGYEVCEYVKNDARYSHIPVVLLLGAFDPLDENEAKRVGADGVLKKPFVPPDPMIALVKALLEKSAPERLAQVPVPVAVAAGPETHAVPEQPAFRPTRVLEPLPPIEESPEIDYPPMGRDAFDSAAPVVASGSMVSSVAAEVEDADTDVMTHQHDAGLGEPEAWRPVVSEKAPEPEPEEVSAEEVDRGGDPFVAATEPNPGYFDAPGVPVDFSPTASGPDFSARAEPAAQTENDTAAVMETETSAEAVAVSDTPATPEETGSEWAASPNDWATSAVSAADADLPHTAGAEEQGGSSDWARAEQEPVVELSGASESSFAPSSAVWSEPEPTPAAIESAVIESAEAAQWPQQESPVEPESEQLKAVEESTGWDANLPDASLVEQAAPELADTQEIPADAIAFATHAHEEISAPESPAADPTEVAAPVAVSEDVATHVAASESEVSPAARLSPATTDELVNAVVARVIAKLQPQIAEMINEEILRPVVSALVRREIDNQ